MSASLLRPRDTDALRAELRHVAAAAGLPVTFGGEVHGAALLLTEFVGTQTHSMRGLAVRPSAGLGGATMVARRPMSVAVVQNTPLSPQLVEIKATEVNKKRMSEFNMNFLMKRPVGEEADKGGKAAPAAAAKKG